MAGENVQIQMSAEPETPDQVTAREAAEAAAIARGDEVNINARDKGRNVAISLPAKSAAEGDLPTRPENVPEKFWNAATGEVNIDALLKAQSDGERYINELRSGKPPTKPAEADPKADDAAAAAAAKAAADAAAKPNDKAEPTQEQAIATAQNEFNTTGALTAATYETLAKTGLSKDMVDTYIGAMSQKVTDLKNATYEGAGGEAAFNTMATWATQNMDASQIATINTLLASSDPVVAKTGASQLKAFYDANADIEPKNRLYGEGNRSSGGMFNSKHEMTEAMKSPAYSKDAAFRAEVARKIARSSAAGVNLFS